MASETGHASNVSNLEDLISYCEGYGSSYNPSKTSLTITNLKSLFTEGGKLIETVSQTKVPFDKAIGERQAAFDPIKKLATRIINAVETSDVSKKAVENAKSINAKLQGKRVDNTPDPTPAEGESKQEDNSISVSQQGYDKVRENFSKLIELLSAETGYKPNEVDLQVPSLEAIAAKLKLTNSEVIKFTTPYSNARIARDAFLYTPETGLVDIALDVKKYVKSVFGATSPQFKQVSGIPFTKSKS